MDPDPVTPGDEETAPARADEVRRTSQKTTRLLGWVGIVLHSTVVALYYFLSVLVMPVWAAYVLWGIWALLLVLAILFLRRRSPWALAVPFAASGLWFLAVTLGEQHLGWTA